MSDLKKIVKGTRETDRALLAEIRGTIHLLQKVTLAIKKLSKLEEALVESIDRLNKLWKKLEEDEKYNRTRLEQSLSPHPTD